MTLSILRRAALAWALVVGAATSQRSGEFSASLATDVFVDHMTRLGYEPVRGHRLEAGDDAFVIDAYDAARRVGFLFVDERHTGRTDASIDRFRRTLASTGDRVAFLRSAAFRTGSTPYDAVRALRHLERAVDAFLGDVAVDLSDEVLFDHLARGHTITVARVIDGERPLWNVDAVLAPAHPCWVSVPSSGPGPPGARARRYVFVTEQAFFFHRILRAIAVPEAYDVSTLRARIDAWTARSGAAQALADPATDSLDLVGVPPAKALRAHGVERRHVRAWLAAGRRIVCVRPRRWYPRKSVHEFQALRTLYGLPGDDLIAHAPDGKLEGGRIHVVVLGENPHGEPVITSSIRVIGTECPEVELLRRWILEDMTRLR